MRSMTKEFLLLSLAPKQHGIAAGDGIECMQGGAEWIIGSQQTCRPYAQEQLDHEYYRDGEESRNCI